MRVSDIRDRIARVIYESLSGKYGDFAWPGEAADALLAEFPILAGPTGLPHLPDNARMQGYYIGFERTGVGPVDAILSAVAIAAKGSHSTDGWADEDTHDYYHGWPGLPDTESAVELIQQTAEQSAAQIRAVLGTPGDVSTEHVRDHLSICKRCGEGLTARAIVDGETPCPGDGSAT